MGGGDGRHVKETADLAVCSIRRPKASKEPKKRGKAHTCQDVCTQVTDWTR